MFKKILLFCVIIALFNSCDTLSKLPIGGSITDAEAAQAIREALTQGTGKGISFLNKTDGFFGNEAYKLFLPPDAKKIENALRTIGMGNMVDKAILQINRAAEDAVGYAKPIFVDAIKEMTIMDAINIVRGTNDAATNYFRQKTTDKLITAFTPSIKNSLDKLNATKYYADVVNAYNNFPTTFNKINPDLPSYVVGKAVDALFDQIAKEEANIRENPVARTTEILKKVFGNAGH
jgi:ABC-type transporter MlaC component